VIGASDAEAAKTLFNATLASPGGTPQLRQDEPIDLSDIDRSERRHEASALKWNSAIELARGGHNQVAKASRCAICEDVVRAEPLFRHSACSSQIHPHPNRRRSRTCSTNSRRSQGEAIFPKMALRERYGSGFRFPCGRTDAGETPTLHYAWFGTCLPASTVVIGNSL
jgi:hypothetical protein